MRTTCPCFITDVYVQETLQDRLRLAGYLQSQFFRNPLPNLRRQPVMQSLRTQFRQINSHDRRRRRNGYQQPDESREQEAGDRSNFQYQRMARLEMPDHPECQQEEKGG